VSLYEKESGIKINENTAKNQKGKWLIVNGELYKKKKTKQKIPIADEHEEHEESPNEEEVFDDAGLILNDKFIAGLSGSLAEIENKNQTENQK